MLAGGLIIALFMASQFAAPDPAPAARTTRSLTQFDQFKSIPIGLCEDYPPESTSPQRIRRDMALLRSLGVTHLRVSFGWDDLEPVDDRFDWSFADEFVRIAVDECGITLLPYVCYTPAWAADSQAGAADAWRAPPARRGEFAEVMFHLVNRYKDRIHTWELWNEPDNRDYWTGTPGQYDALLREGAAAVRAADPSAKVVLGGLAWNLDFLRELFEDYDAQRDVDIINLHNYAETWFAKPIESISDYLDAASDIAKEHGEGEPLWMAEMGYSSLRHGARVSDWHAAAYEYEHTQKFQAAALIRMLTLTLASPDVQLIAWYELSDLPHDGEVIGDDNNRHLGILTHDGDAKPALHAMHLAARMFSKPMRCIDDQTEVNRTAGSHSHVHVFERADGSAAIIAWLSTMHDDRPHHQAGTAADDRFETIDVKINDRQLTAIQSHDEHGNPMVLPPIERRDGATHVQRLQLRGGSVTIIELR